MQSAVLCPVPAVSPNRSAAARPRRPAEFDTPPHFNVDRFTAIVAHELRNPLSPIRNAAAALRRAHDTASVQRACDIIDRQIGEMSRLIEDILDVSRSQLRTFVLQRCITSLDDIVERGLEASEPFVAARGHELLVSLPQERVFVDADPMRMSQVLQNLVRNAAKYTPRGGTIRIEGRTDGNDAILIVTDTGIGIVPAQLDEIFGLYAQAGEAGTERSAGGLGIGLYLARALMQAHGGTVRASSPGPGLGSEFVLRLQRQMSFG